MELTKEVNDLLLEIWDHRLANGNCDSTYWKCRFDQVSNNDYEDTLLRDRFGKLQEAKFINVLWADDFPYLIRLLDSGVSYIVNREKMMRSNKMIQRATVFVSYNQKSGSEFVDSLEKKLCDKATVLRDKNDINPWDSISQFMSSIRKQDFVVSVVTDEYMKSEACMYEMSIMLRESDWRERLMIVLPNGFDYANAERYEEYWENKKAEVVEKIKAGETSVDLLKDSLSRIKKIIAEISDFIEFIKDRKNPPIWDVLDAIEHKVTSSSTSEEIPEEYILLTEVENAKNALSHEAKELLISAFKTHKRILCVTSLSGTQILLDGEQASTFMKQEEMLNALAQLEQFGYVESVNSNREIFNVTKRGKTIADKLEIEKLLE